MANCRLCLVTDRRRLARACGQPIERWRPALVRQIEGAVAAGVDLVQVRERDLTAQVLADLVTTLVDMTRGSRTRVLVNDRVDIALARGADGAHLREDSPSPSAVRRLAPHGWLLGRAVHGVDGVRHAHGADFLVAGTVFPTPSKTDTIQLLGLDGLAAVVRAGEVPVLAIGGVGETTAREVARTGAAGLASIGAFLPRQPSDDPATSVQERVIDLRVAFDG